MIKKRESAAVREEIYEQWKHIAAMYDRVLFVFFVTTIFGISTWFLTLQPTEGDQKQDF